MALLAGPGDGLICRRLRVRRPSAPDPGLLRVVGLGRLWTDLKVALLCWRGRRGGRMEGVAGQPRGDRGGFRSGGTWLSKEHLE